MLVQGHQGPFLFFSGVSSVSNRYAEGPADCGSGVFIAEEVDEVGEKGLGNTKPVNVQTLVKAFF
jgi:hypothetical protein